MTQKPRNADYTKEYNRKAVLSMLRRSSMSRAELARATGLSRAATSLIAEELLKDGIVMELPPQSVGRGRSATPLAVRADSYYALAVDLARKSCSVGLCDMSGHLLQFRAFPDQDGLLDLIIEALRRMAQSVDKSKILGIGISSPGPLDCEGGKILNPPQFDRWHGVEISAILSQALDLPAYLEHDVCALALHQLEMGHSRNFMLVFVDIGIGAAIAKKLASEGADIAILYVGNPAPAEETVAAIEAMGRKVACKVCDVSNFEETQAAIKEIISEFGGVDILVNNAGITRDKVLLAMTEADWDSVLDVNLKSMFNTIKACYRNFMKKKAGKIINISSVAGLTGNAGQANYSSSKAGVVGLTKTVARELASRHINCNAIAPGAIRTPMTDAMDPKDLQAILDTIPLGFMGEADDIAELAAYLASDKAKYITGEVIRVDGGIAM